MEHTEIVAVLGALAPLELAEEWDRVGLLVEPDCTIPVRRILVALDFTEPVLEEALALEAGFVVCYHPPLFKPLERLRWSEPRERVLMRALQARIALYSPHTALDAAPGGLAEWLAAGLGRGSLEALRPQRPRDAFKVVVFVPAPDAPRLREALAALGAGVIGNYTHCSFNLEGIGTFFGAEGSDPAVGQSGRLEEVGELRLEMVCPAHLLGRLAATIRSAHPYEEPAWEVYPLATPVDPGRGTGRLLELDRPASLEGLALRLARHLGVRAVESFGATSGKDARIRRVACCPGAGASLLREHANVDAWLCGELGHHDILAALGRGIGLLLPGHAASEWGYLPVLARRLSERLGPEIEVRVSRILPPGVRPRGGSTGPRKRPERLG